MGKREGRRRQPQVATGKGRRGSEGTCLGVHEAEGACTQPQGSQPIADNARTCLLDLVRSLDEMSAHFLEPWTSTRRCSSSSSCVGSPVDLSVARPCLVQAATGTTQPPYDFPVPLRTSGVQTRAVGMSAVGAGVLAEYDRSQRASTPTQTAVWTKE